MIPDTFTGTFTIQASGHKMPDGTPEKGTKIEIESSSVKIGKEYPATYNKEHDTIYFTDDKGGNYQISVDTNPDTTGKKWIFGTRKVNLGVDFECPGAAGVFGAEDDG